MEHTWSDDMEEYKKLNPKSKASMYLGNLITIVIFAAIIFVVLYLGTDYIADNTSMSTINVHIVAGILLALLIVYLLIEPIVFYNRYRYKINDERIDVRRGVIIIRRTMVPIERVHQVEVTRGPINNAFGLANVEITTAGGTAVIEYLELEQAEEIAKHLNVIVNRIVKGLRDADE